MDKMALLDNFRQNLRAQMRARHMTGRALAQATGLHEVSISRILHGHQSPDLDTCETLARAVGLRPDLAFLEPARETVTPS